MYSRGSIVGPGPLVKNHCFIGATHWYESYQVFDNSSVYSIFTCLCLQWFVALYIYRLKEQYNIISLPYPFIAEVSLWHQVDVLGKPLIKFIHNCNYCHIPIN